MTIEKKTVAAAIIPAAGQGNRMGGPVPKQFLELSGVPILVHTVRLFLDLPEFMTVVVVVAEDRINRTKALVDHFFPRNQRSRIIVTRGGKTRQESVRAGLAVLPDQVNVILVHDGARPLISAAIIQSCLKKALQGAVIAAVEVKDTLKMVIDSRIEKTVDRKSLFLAQTPQGARKSLFEQAFSKAEEDNFVGTDEASLFEHAGIEVTVVPGSADNIKITWPEDVKLAQAILNSRRGNRSQGTESFRDQPGLRMTNTLRRAACENLRHPVTCYKYDD